MNFQIVNAVIALLALGCFIYTGLFAPEPLPEYCLEDVKEKQDKTDVSLRKRYHCYIEYSILINFGNTISIITDAL